MTNTRPWPTLKVWPFTSIFRSIVGELLEDLGRERFTDFPRPPSEPGENDGEGVTSEGDSGEG